MLALSRTRDFHSARAFVRKDVFRPPKLRGLQVPLVRRHRSLDGARTIVTQGLTPKGSRPASPDLVFRKNVAIFIGIPFLRGDRILWESVFSFDLDLRRRGRRRKIKEISLVRPLR